MANKKVSDLTEILSTQTSPDDRIVILDVNSDNTGISELKNMKISEFSSYAGDVFQGNITELNSNFLLLSSSHQNLSQSYLVNSSSVSNSIINLSSSLESRLNSNLTGSFVAFGIPVLDSNGKIYTASLPPVSVTVGVSSVFSRTGNVSALASDYSSFYLPFSGGSLTGNLTLSGLPSSDFHASPKIYVDTLISQVSSSIVNTSASLQSVSSSINNRINSISSSLIQLSSSIGGGGSLINFIESVDTSAPNTDRPVVQLLANNPALNVDIAITPKGNGAITAVVADDGLTGGIKRGIHAVDLQVTRGMPTHVASGPYSVAMGTNNEASGSFSIAMGSTNFAWGLSSVAIGMGNTAAGRRSVSMGNSNSAFGISSIAMGENNNVLASASVAMGKNNTIVGGDDCSIAMGEENLVSSMNSVAIGTDNVASGFMSSVMGSGNIVSATNSFVPGGLNGRANRRSQLSHAAGQFTAIGDNQHTILQARCSTTDATPTILTTDGATPGADNHISVAIGQTLYGRVIIQGRANGGATFAAFERQFHIGRAGTGNVVLQTVNTIGIDFNTPGWNVTLSADTITNHLAITVTGAASTTIRWHAVLYISELTHG